MSKLREAFHMYMTTEMLERFERAAARLDLERTTIARTSLELYLTLVENAPAELHDLDLQLYVRNALRALQPLLLDPASLTPAAPSSTHRSHATAQAAPKSRKRA